MPFREGAAPTEVSPTQRRLLGARRARCASTERARRAVSRDRSNPRQSRSRREAARESRVQKLDDVLDASRFGTLETVVEGSGSCTARRTSASSGATAPRSPSTRARCSRAPRSSRRCAAPPTSRSSTSSIHTATSTTSAAPRRSCRRRARAAGRGPTVWAHENVLGRLMRYQRTWRWNNEVNRRQLRLPRGMNTFPRGLVPPDRTYRDRDDFELAGERVELYHATAETDDATWVWLPDRHVAFVGDLLIGSLPNTGHPNKTQRYTLGWAQALDTVAAHRPRWVIPGHGELLEGDYALEVMTETSRALRFLHDSVVERMNAGKWPDEIVEEGIQLPASLASKPYLAETSGCAQFVVRDVLRAYAGWWGGNPAELIPAARGQVARDVVALAGREAILDRVGKLFIAGEARRALHLAVLLRQANPDRRRRLADRGRALRSARDRRALGDRARLLPRLRRAAAREAFARARRGREALALERRDTELPRDAADHRRRRRHNGLVCAAYLARAGVSVTLLERRPVLGGACVTEELWPGYRVSRAAYVLSLFRPAIAAELELARHGLRLLPRSPSSITPLAGRARARARRRARATTSRRSSSSRGATRSATAATRRGSRESRRRSSRCSTTRRRGCVRARRLARGCARGSRRRAARVAARSCSARRARCSRSGSSPSRCARPWRPTRSSARSRRRRRAAPATCLFHHVHGRAGGRRGVWAYVAGGMGALSEALAAAARAAGATLRTDAEVVAIRMRGGRACGVALASGETLDADLVVSGADLARTAALVDDTEVRRAFRAADYAQPRREAEPGARRAAAVSRAGRRVAAALGHDPRRADRPRRHRARVRGRRAAGGSRSCRSSSSRSLRSSTRAWRRRASTSRRSSRSTRRCCRPTTRAGPRCATPCASACWPRSRRSRRASAASIEHLEVLAAPDLEREFGLTGGNIFHGAMRPAAAPAARGRARGSRPYRIAAARALAVRRRRHTPVAASWARRGGTRARAACCRVASAR